jgi:hypothetical protein
VEKQAKRVSKRDGVRAGVGAGLTVTILGAVLLVQCGGRESTETAGTLSLAAVISSVTEKAQRWNVKFTGGPLITSSASEYTVAAIGPQTGNTPCANGAMLLTHGPTQSIVRSTLSCLNTPGSCSSPNFQSGVSPQPVPVRYLGNNCSLNFTTSPDATHPFPEFQLGFTDAEAIRIGPTSFLHFATGIHNRYAPNCQLNQLQTSAPPNTPFKYFTDYFRRSDDCGSTWPMTGSFSNYTEVQWSDANIPGWNFDMPHLYVDPYNLSPSGNYYAYAYGSVGTVAKGIIESGDMGATWAQKGYIGDNAGDGWGLNDGWSVGGNMTSTMDGTQFFAGCYFDKVRLFYSYDRWATYSMYELDWQGGSPNCAVLSNSQWPAGAQQLNVGPFAVAVSRLSRNALVDNYARVRLAYPFVVGSGSAARQRYRIFVVAVKRKGATGTISPVQTFVQELGDANNSFLEAGFTEPDPFDTPRGGVSGLELPDTSVLWTMEGNHATPSLQFRYRVVQGAYTYSSPRDLSNNNWVYNASGGQKWNGDYNRSGAYYYDKNAKRYDYLFVWPQGNNAAPTLSTRVEPHYNVVTIAPPVSLATVNVEKLDFGAVHSSPAVASQSSSKMDVFWLDGNGDLIQKSYSSGWITGTTSRGKPSVGLEGSPAAASWGSSRLDVFQRGGDDKLYQWWWNGTPQGWVLIDNETIASSPAVTDAGSGVLYVFVRRSDNTIAYRKYTNATGWIPGWTNLGGDVVGNPSAISMGSNVHVLMRSAIGRIYQRWTGDGGATWSDWEILSASADYAPAAVSWGPGRVDVFHRYDAPSGPTLFHNAFEGGWQDEWQDLRTDRGNSLDWTGDPDAVSRSSGTIDVFARTTDNRLWHMSYAP